MDEGVIDRRTLDRRDGGTAYVEARWSSVLAVFFAMIDPGSKMRLETIWTTWTGLSD